MKTTSLIFVFLLASYSITFAQEKDDQSPFKRWEIGVNAGVANFAGTTGTSKEASMKHFNDFKSDMDFGYGMFLRKNFTRVFALEGAYIGSKLTGSPKETSKGVLAFKTGINEFVLNSVWNLSNLFSKSRADGKIDWYAKLGVGSTYIAGYKYTDLVTSGSYFTVPVGTGLAYHINDNVKLDLGIQYSWVVTNQLDGRLQGGAGTNFKVYEVAEQYFYTHAGVSFLINQKEVKPEPIVVFPKAEPKPEPKPEPKAEPKPETKPEPKPEPKMVSPQAPKHLTPASVGQVFKVFFPYDKSILSQADQAELNRLVKELQENLSLKVELKSYTDNRGAAEYNMKLSEKHGKSVIEYLTSKGINVSRINSQAFGETQPINKCKDGVNCTEAEYQANRRTEILVVE